MASLLIAENYALLFQIVAYAVCFVKLALPPGIISILYRFLNLLWTRSTFWTLPWICIWCRHRRARSTWSTASYGLLFAVFSSTLRMWVGFPSMVFLSFRNRRRPLGFVMLRAPSVILCVNFEKQVLCHSCCDDVAILLRTRNAELQGFTGLNVCVSLHEARALAT